MKICWIAALTALTAFAQDARFEVASVKPAAEDRPGYSIRNEPGRMETRNTTLHELIEYAFSVRAFQVVDGPAWVRNARFDITAKNEPGEEPRSNAARWERERARLRHLLEDRFQLELRQEQREVPIYALTVDKGGPKMVAAEPLGNVDSTKTRDGSMMKLKGGTMARLAEVLSGVVERPVVDETGLAGAFDLELKYSFEMSEDPSPDAYPSIFTALKDQLGLKLTGKKGISPVWVIVKAEKPGEN